MTLESLESVDRENLVSADSFISGRDGHGEPSGIEQVGCLCAVAQLETTSGGMSMETSSKTMAF